MSADQKMKITFLEAQTCENFDKNLRKIDKIMFSVNEICHFSRVFEVKNLKYTYKKFVNLFSHTSISSLPESNLSFLGQFFKNLKMTRKNIE